MQIEKFLIGNDFISSDAVAEIKNPYTNEVVSKAYKSGTDHINSSLDYLTEVFSKYKNSPVYLKAELLEKISLKISERKEELAKLITSETGKPVKFSRIEIDRAALTFKLGSEESKRIEGEVIDLDLLKGSENVTGIIKRFPIGLILAITPWNFPVNLVAHKLAPALASGNVVLLKPASASLTCGIEIVKIIKESCDELELDYCPVNVVTSSGSEIEKFISDDRIKMISFTGSSEVGWKLKKKINRQKISLELGGNAGVIVDQSADIKGAVAKIILGGFGQAGQSCISVQRVFVHEKIYDEFEKILIEETKKVKVGNPYKDDTDVASMITENDAKKIETWIKDAVGSGAELIAGGKRVNAVLEPAILVNTTKEMDVNSKEVFAPVITLTKFSEFKKAVEEVNDSIFGLQAGVFTENIHNAFYAFNNIETGGVIINNVSTYRMDSMPYGGLKDSGNSREGVKYAIEEMTERKVMVVT
ncbi:MAG: aldehyde dehydrogenase family protein [Ignavibacteria bacterium]|nr:aldehyde dehydrogenase family protein [Ignavibacteria bacterium]